MINITDNIYTPITTAMPLLHGESVWTAFAYTIFVDSATVPMYHFQYTRSTPPFDLLVVGDIGRDQFLSAIDGHGFPFYQLVGIIGYGLTKDYDSSSMLALYAWFGTEANSNSNFVREGFLSRSNTINNGTYAACVLSSASYTYKRQYIQTVYLPKHNLEGSNFCPFHYFGESIRHCAFPKQRF